MTPIQNKVDNIASIINSQQATLTNQQSAIDGNLISFIEQQMFDFSHIIYSISTGVTKNLIDTSNSLEGKINGNLKCKTNFKRFFPFLIVFDRPKQKPRGKCHW